MFSRGGPKPPEKPVREHAGLLPACHAHSLNTNETSMLCRAASSVTTWIPDVWAGWGRGRLPAGARLMARGSVAVSSHVGDLHERGAHYLVGFVRKRGNVIRGHAFGLDLWEDLQVYRSWGRQRRGQQYLEIWGCL